MITDGKGSLEEQEFTKQRDKEHFASLAEQQAAEQARYSDRREFTDEAGSTWTYAVYNGESVTIFGCASTNTSIKVPAEIENLPVTVLQTGSMGNLPMLEEVEVPACVNTIAKYAFRNCPELRRVILPCEVTEYEPNWYDVSKKIEELVLPNGIEQLKPNVFDLDHLRKLTIGTGTRELIPGMFGRSKLEEFDIAPDNPYLKTDGTGIYSKDGKILYALAKPCESYTVADGCVELAKKAFSTFGCLKEVHLPDSLEIIGEFAFSRVGLTEFIAPPNVREIRKNAFINCRGLERVTLNDKVEVIGDEAFAVTAISELYFPKSLRTLGNRVALTTNCTFSGDKASFAIDPACENLKLDEQGCLYAIQDDGLLLMRYLDTELTELTVADGTTIIGESAFMKHPNLQKAILPEGLRVVGACAFKDCEKLTEIVIPSTLERIENEAFVNTRLTELHLPAALEFIGPMALVMAGAFRAEDPPSLKFIEVSPENKRFYKAGSLLCEHLDDGTSQIIVRDTSDPIVRIPDDISVIQPYAMGGAIDIQELRISDHVKTIHMRALSFEGHVRDIYMETQEPLEGQTKFHFAFPNNMRGIRQQGNAFRVMKHVDVPSVFRCYDLTITNSASFDMQGKSDDDLYYQIKLIQNRLNNPVFMDNVTCDTIKKMFKFNMQELGSLFTKFSDRDGFEELMEHGYLTAENMAQAVEGSNMAYDDALHKQENAQDALDVVEARLSKLEEELAAASEDEKAEKQKAVDSTRKRAEKRRAVLESAQAAIDQRTDVHDFLVQTAKERFGLTTEEMDAQIEAIEREKEERNKKAPVNKGRAPVDSYQPGKAGSDSALRKAIFGK